MKSGILRNGIGAAVAVCVLGTATASVAWAHHAGTNFDQSKEFIFKGTVRQWVWENPHAWLYMDVSKANGSTELWGFEAGGPNALERVGLHADTLKPGDKVAVDANPDKRGVHNALLKKIMLDDGRELDLMGKPPAGAGPGGPKGGPTGLPSFPSVPAVEYK